MNENSNNKIIYKIHNNPISLSPRVQRIIQAQGLRVEKIVVQLLLSYYLKELIVWEKNTEHLRKMYVYM